MLYAIEQQVRFQAERCSCQGGGFTEMIGTIVGTLVANNFQLYQINTPEGIKTVKESLIIGAWE